MNNLIPTNGQKKPSFTKWVTTPAAVNQLQSILRNSRVRDNFITDIITVVQTNPGLAECDYMTVLDGGLQAQRNGLNLSSPLGEAFLIPYNSKDRGKVAQFQVGYIGLKKLMMSHGVCRIIKAISVKEGEIKGINPLTGELVEPEWILDPDERRKKPTIGYYAYAVITEKYGGGTYSVYMSKSEVEEHATRYSRGYARHNGSTLWEKDFDMMAEKTVTKKVIKEIGYLPTEIASVLVADQGVINGDGTVTYYDNDVDTVVLPEAQEVIVDEESAPEA